MKKRELKKKGIIKTGTLIIYYVLILSCLILSFTIARYQSNLKNMQSNIDTAKWVFKLSYNNSQITTTQYDINLADTITSVSANVASNYIAPSTAGTIALSIDCTDCEVGVEYFIKITDPNSTLPNQLKFYTSSDYSDASKIELNTEYSNVLELSQINTIQNKTIYWKWIPTDETTINAEDIAKSGTAMSINIIVSGKELIESSN